MTTTTLPFTEPRVGARTKLTLRERAERWMELNPDVYQMFLRFAQEALDSGATRIGVKALAERVRWELALGKRGEFKVNNSYVSFVGRRMVEDMPALEGLIQFRGVRS